MDKKLREIKDEFLMRLYDISKMKMVGYIATFIQGEDAFLLRLYMNKKMTAKELSDELGITKGRVTALINSLKKKNYIDTEINEVDRRSVIIKLTDTGKSYLETKLFTADEYFEKVFTILGLDDAKNLLDSINNLLIKIEGENL